jgi:hypothetical protein
MLLYVEDQRAGVRLRTEGLEKSFMGDPSDKNMINIWECE